MSNHAHKATKKVRKLLLPAWYLPEGTINASDDELGSASSSCESWGLVCGALVVAAVAAEVVIAWIEPPYGLFLRLSLPTDIAVAFGIVGEVLLGMRNNRLQTELRRRSDGKVTEANLRAAKALEGAHFAYKAAKENAEPRKLVPKEFKEYIQKAPPAKAEVLYVRECADCLWLAFSIRALLMGAKWEITEYRPLEQPTGEKAHLPAAMAAGGARTWRHNNRQTAAFLGGVR
jgi:hypothetical protein